MFATWLGRITALSLLLAAVTLPLTRIDSVAAVSASDWKAGRIIDDTVFMDANSMSVSDIQNFLNSKVPSCDTNGTKPASEFGRSDLTHAQYAASRGWPGPPYVCLKNYYEVPKSSPGPGVPANNYSGSIPSGAISAAQMIYNAAQKYSINPKVLLVMIQKESAGPLTTDTWPLQSQYTYAMGAHCPDSGPGGSANCDSNYAGFSLQIAESAALMRWYLDSMSQSWWQYKKPYETNSILWNVAQTGCGAGNVYIESKATAALYTYTPYQPNAAALANMYGTGDGCSAYGNRNFWRIYNDWFGTTSGTPFFQVTGDSKVYIRGTSNTYYYVPNPTIMRNYGWESKVTFIDKYPTSYISNKTLAGAILPTARFEGNEIYYIHNGNYYHFTSRSLLQDYGLDIGMEALLPQDYKSFFINAGVVSNIALDDSNGKIYYVENGSKRHFTGPSAYQSGYPTYSSLSRITDTTSLLKDLTEGSTIYAPGTLFQFTGENKLYVITSKDSYSYIKNPSIIRTFGFNTKNIIKVPKTNMVDYDRGADLNEVVIKNSNKGLRLIQNGATFMSLPYVAAANYSPAIVVENLATVDDSMLYKYAAGGVLGSLMRQYGTSAVYLIRNGEKHHVTSRDALTRLGYSMSDVVDLTDSLLSNLPLGDPIY